MVCWAVKVSSVIYNYVTKDSGEGTHKHSINISKRGVGRAQGVFVCAKGDKFSQD